MTPSLWGRIQTRIVLLTTVGVVATVLVTPLLGAADLDDMYAVTFRSLAVVAIVGIGWELFYHFLQQFRWEKDWPTVFGLLTGINEAVLAWFVLDAVLPERLTVTTGQFIAHFATVWILVWLVAIGPMRVVALRWRFHGGRLIGGRAR